MVAAHGFVARGDLGAAPRHLGGGVGGARRECVAGGGRPPPAGGRWPGRPCAVDGDERGEANGLLRDGGRRRGARPNVRSGVVHFLRCRRGGGGGGRGAGGAEAGSRVGERFTRTVAGRARGARVVLRTLAIV